jgi:hypothetical protein
MITLNEKSMVKKRLKIYDCPGCIGFVNRALIKLVNMPILDPAGFYTQKSLYPLNVMLVCDDQNRFAYFLLDSCGSFHDRYIYESDLKVIFNTVITCLQILPTRP